MGHGRWHCRARHRGQSDRRRLAARLVGSWVDIEDPATSVTFVGSKDLVYSMKASGGVQRILLRYVVDGADLVSDQPNKPDETRTPISLGDDGTLYLRDNGVKRWRREDPDKIADPMPRSSRSSASPHATRLARRRRAARWIRSS